MSIVVWGVYAIVVGLAFLFFPNMVLPLFGLPTTTEVWVRVVGLLVTIIGVYYFYCGRNNAVPFFRITVLGRFMVLIGLTALAVLDMSEPSIILFGIIDTGGAIWTWWALRAVA